MDKIKIIGKNRLNGEIEISGSKNSSLPLMAASLLTNDDLELSNIPNLDDVVTMSNLLGFLGVKITIDGLSPSSDGRVMILNSSSISNLFAPYDMVRKMRASIFLLGPMISRFGEAKISLPGGCAIGARPVNIHLNALEKMGVQIDIKNGYIYAKSASRLKAANIYFDFASVGATENILMAATIANGTTVINNAAKEPEIIDLANCLNKMGAKISGIGTSTIAIEGVEELHGTRHKVISDRIEAGTYLIASAITGGNILLKNVDIEPLKLFIDKLLESGVEINLYKDSILIKSRLGNIRSVDITTKPYPGFATDMQAQFMALMSIANGTSNIREEIFENRFMHVAELSRMGANIILHGNHAVVHGVKSLKGAQVMATDLRASVSLVLAALAADGESIINRIYHIDRGYENIEQKLSSVGANIERIKNIVIA